MQRELDRRSSGVKPRRCIRHDERTHLVLTFRPVPWPSPSLHRVLSSPPSLSSKPQAWRVWLSASHPRRVVSPPFVLEEEPLEASVHGVSDRGSVNGVGSGRGHLCGRRGTFSGGHGRAHCNTCRPGTDHGHGLCLCPFPCGPCPSLYPSRRRTSTWWAGASLATETAVKSGGKVLPSYSDCPVSMICLVAPLRVSMGVEDEGSSVGSACTWAVASNVLFVLSYEVPYLEGVRVSELPGRWWRLKASTSVVRNHHYRDHVCKRPRPLCLDTSYTDKASIFQEASRIATGCHSSTHPHCSHCSGLPAHRGRRERPCAHF